MFIGLKVEIDFEVVEVNDEKEMYVKMEELLDLGYIDVCVIMYYNFLIGVFIVGRVIILVKGKEMIFVIIIGISVINRIEVMVRNVIYGIVIVKLMGNKCLKVGIFNVDGVR